MPCTTPPCTWPSTMIGLTTLPTSSTQTYLRSLTRPVSVSTSAAHRCVPCGNENVAGSNVASESSVGSTPSGKLCAANTARAQSPMVLDASGDPFTRNAPLLNSRPSADPSSMCAAIGLAFSRTFCAAMTSATPPTVNERDPYVSSPLTDVRVSPCSTSTSSNATPSWSATIWLHAVSCPCPCALLPV